MNACKAMVYIVKIVKLGITSKLSLLRDFKAKYASQIAIKIAEFVNQEENA